MIGRLMPLALAPLAILATGLASSMWLRPFPAATLAVPLFGAAVLSVLVSTALVRLSRRSMLWTVPAGLLALLLYLLLMVLRSPLGFGDLISGFSDGPAQLLSFALPLVSPRSLMVWPVTLCWVAGLLAAESLARSRYTLLPYAGWLVAFAAGYAGSSRAMGADAATAQRVDLVVAAALLLVLILLRVAQSWLQQDASSERAGTAADNELPVQRIVSGIATALVVVLVAGYLASTSYFDGPPTQLKRVPAVIVADPTTPLAYVASLRPASRTDPGTALFDVTVDRPVPGYLGIASVDFYDGDSWSFTRDFRPSGGIVPADTDPDLAPQVPVVTQDFHIRSGLITSAPWMPSIFRPQRVTGVPVSVDPLSGMIVPTGQLSNGQRYTVRSTPAARTVSDLPPGWLPATSAPPVDTQLPGQLRSTLANVVASFATETGQSSSSPTSFLQAVVADLRSNYLQSQALPTGNGAAPASPVRSSASGKAATKPAAKPSRPSSKPARKTSSKPAKRPTPSATPTSSATSNSSTAIGGNSVAAVLAAILGPLRSGTPEQFATLCALVARDLGIPARVVSGFRVTGADGTHQLPAGNRLITSRDAYTWVEIPVRGAGWMVLDPSPARFASTDAQPSVGVSKTSSPSRTPTQAALATDSSGGHAVAPKSVVQDQHARGRQHRWYLIPAALLVLGLLLAGLLLGAKRLRLERRRRVRDARQRVIAAWQETLDVLQECGLGELRMLTGAEISSAAGQRFGPVPAGHVAAVAGVADLAAFSEQIPIGARHADEAWDAHRAARKTVRAALSPADRARSYLRVRRPAGSARKVLATRGTAAGHRRRH